ncbi:MAG TPA: HEAT repeat domain-containing protein, partial [Polyangia bacterium]|nr:HEAT repeat domain-containing protein [Polyangia bacterium]
MRPIGCLAVPTSWVTACTVATITAGAAGRASADWAVKREDSRALVEQAMRAFTSDPDDDGPWTRLRAVAGRAELCHQLPELARRADESAHYLAIEAAARVQLLCDQSAAAAAGFARASELRPDAIGPRVGRAAALKAAGDRPGAIAALESALRLADKPRLRRPILESMLPLAVAANDVERELGIRRQLLQLAPRSRAASDELIAALARAGRAGEAAAILEQRLRDRPDERTSQGLRLAELKEAAGDDDGAARLLAELRGRVPAGAVERRRALWSRTLEVERRRGRLPELARELDQAPGGVEWEVLSHVRDELGDPEAALLAARRAGALQPRNVTVRKWTVSLLDRLGRQEPAIVEYESLASLMPREVRFTAEIIERRFRRGETPLAQATFDRALARFGNDAAALTTLAQLAAHWSDEPRAIAAWQRLRRIAPGDEAAIVGLGELYFQRGKKESAIRTWRELIHASPQAPGSKTQGYLRFADVLMEHELLDEARAAAGTASDLEPTQPGPHRTFAQIAERRHRVDTAIAEWEKVLELCNGPHQAGARYEARSRILALAARDGRTRLVQRAAVFQEQWRQHPQDRELALFVAEAQQRSGSLTAAITTLRAIIERDQSLAPPPEAAADTVTTLVRLLRQTRQLEEAVTWLRRLVADHPGRAKEAEIQMAEIELGRYDDEAAVAHARSAEGLAATDAQALARIGAIEERAGRDELALATYRRAATTESGGASASLGVARVLERHGEAREAAQVLRALLRTTSEDDVVNEAGRRALDLEEYLGTREDLARAIAILAVSERDGAIYRRLFVDALRRVVPALYRARGRGAAGTAEASAARASIAQRGLRPLLETVAESEAAPDPTLVELLGMLGNPDAAPVLARLAAEPPDAIKATAASGAARAAALAVTDVQRAAVIALGRLRDERGRAVLEQAAGASDSGLRAAALWSIGRLAGQASADLYVKALSDRSEDVVAMACLGLGRSREPRFSATLMSLARDLTRSPTIRRAALTALGLSGDRGATTTLAIMLSSGASDLSTAAAVGLAAIGDPQAVSALLSYSLLGNGRGTEARRPWLDALDRLARTLRTGAPPAIPDEGLAVDGIRIDVEVILEALETSAPDGITDIDRGDLDRTGLWIERPNEMARIVLQGLGGDTDQKRRVLSMLDSRREGLGLGPL